MKTFLPLWMHRLLLIWGAFSLIALVVVGITTGARIVLRNSSRIDQAVGQDVHFVLDECGLPENRLEKVVRVLVASHSVGGDQLDAYAIQLSQVDASELAPAALAAHAQVYRGDQLPAVVQQALDAAIGWLGHNNTAWFPSLKELQSNGVYVYPMRIDLHSGLPIAVEFIVIRPADAMLFFVRSKPD